MSGTLDYETNEERKAYDLGAEMAKTGVRGMSGEGNEPHISDVMDAVWDYTDGDPGYGDLANITAAWEAGNAEAGA